MTLFSVALVIGIFFSNLFDSGESKINQTSLKTIAEFSAEQSKIAKENLFDDSGSPSCQNQFFNADFTQIQKKFHRKIGNSKDEAKALEKLMEQLNAALERESKVHTLLYLENCNGYK